MLQVNWTVVDTVHLRDDKFVMRQCEDQGLTGDSKLNDSSAYTGVHVVP